MTPVSSARSRRFRPVSRALGPGVQDVSWAALVAAATLGDSFSSVHARIIGEGGVGRGGNETREPKDPWRLIVQSYSKTSLGRASVPMARAKPLGSLQRAVTPDELQRGVNVDLLHLGPSGLRPVVVAWVERGAPDLEFDGLRARPPAHAWYGTAYPSGSRQSATVVLRRPAA